LRGAANHTSHIVRLAFNPEESNRCEGDSVRVARGPNSADGTSDDDCSPRALLPRRRRHLARAVEAPLRRHLGEFGEASFFFADASDLGTPTLRERSVELLARIAGASL
jgi:hypothetical protein